VSAERLKALLAGPPQRKLTVAESVTCGGLQQRIGRVSGASEFFLGGITAYSAGIKARYLGVNAAAAEAVNSVSSEIAGQMAIGACAMFGADVALATTGYAEPNAAWEAVDPFAYWAAAQGGKLLGAGRIDCPGCNRTQAQDRIAEQALEALVALLELEK
jgi:nicotinamide-nucleotide amidase